MSSPDQLTIETPEQTALEFPVAGIGSRFLAVALDTLIQAAAAISCLIFVGFVLPRFVPRHRGGVWLAAMLIMIAFLLEFVYYAFFEALWNGQTPGKRLTNLRVIKDSGRPISAFEAILRNLLRIVDSLPGIYAVGIVCAVFSRQSKRLGDWVAGTVVVHEKPLQGYRPVWETAVKVGAPPFDARKLSVEELGLVESFLDRRSSLESAVRRDMAQQIANRLGQQLNIPAESRPDAEKFLETLAELRRGAARY